MQFIELKNTITFRVSQVKYVMVAPESQNILRIQFIDNDYIDVTYDDEADMENDYEEISKRLLVSQK